MKCHSPWNYPWNRNQNPHHNLKQWSSVSGNYLSNCIIDHIISSAASTILGLNQQLLKISSDVYHYIQNVGLYFLRFPSQFYKKLVNVSLFKLYMTFNEDILVYFIYFLLSIYSVSNPYLLISSPEVVIETLITIRKRYQKVLTH